jgi:prevent-host-death family protein
MQQFNVAEAKARLSQLVQKALNGEDVVIARDNKPLVKLVPIRRTTGRRHPGSAKGQVTMIVTRSTGFLSRRRGSRA